MLDAKMIVRALERTGKSKGGLARAMGARPGAVSEILSGIRLIAFEVSGDSMLPKYENGDVIVCYREQRHPLSSFYGEEAVVRLKTGERYLKTVERGKGTGLVNLSSFNAKGINGVKLDWIGEICLTLPRGQIGRLRSRAAARARKAKSGR
jgi:repressor LexA